MAMIVSIPASQLNQTLTTCLQSTPFLFPSSHSPNTTTFQRLLSRPPSRSPFSSVLLALLSSVSLVITGEGNGPCNPTPPRNRQTAYLMQLWHRVINMFIIGILQIGTIYAKNYGQFLAVRSLFGLGTFRFPTASTHRELTFRHPRYGWSLG